MTDEDALAQFRSSMVLIKHSAAKATEAGTIERFFRELNRECHALVPRFRPGFTLIAEIVPSAQLTLWEDFAQKQKRSR